MQRGNVGILKKVDIRQADARLQASALDRDRRCLKKQRVLSVVQRQPVNHQAGAGQPHQRMRQPFRQQPGAGEHNRGSSVRQRGHIIQVERSVHSPGFEIAFGFDGFGIHCVRVVYRVSMGDDRKSSQSLARELVFMQVALH